MQVYSCRGSVYWGGKVFLGLIVPEESPFWQEQENLGAWDTELKKGGVYNKFQPASEILITNYPNIGASEVRAWCHETVARDWQKFRSSENYNRLSYNSAFPWQAYGENGEVSMNYLIKNPLNQWEAFRLYTFKKFENEIYYRDVVLETSAEIKMNLADIPLPNGILRVDRNISSLNTEMRLGHYSLPHFDAPIKTSSKKVKGHKVTIIDNGQYQLAMIPVLGWNETSIVEAEGLNPVTNKSSVIIVSAQHNQKTDGEIYATLMLWKNSGEKWTKQDLMPIKSIEATNNNTEIKIIFKDGTTRTVKYD